MPDKSRIGAEMQTFAVNPACLWTLGSHWGRVQARCAQRVCWPCWRARAWLLLVPWDAPALCTHTASSCRAPRADGLVPGTRHPCCGAGVLASRPIRSLTGRAMP